MSLLSLAPILFLLPTLTTAQDPPPIFPTLDSLNMLGTGCPLGGGGIGAGAVNGTPVFKFTMWNLNLADLDSEDSDSAGEDPDDENRPANSVEKFCVEEMQLGGGPPGYRIRIPAVTVSGVAELEEGSALKVAVEATLGDIEGGVSQSTPEISPKIGKV